MSDQPQRTRLAIAQEFFRRVEGHDWDIAKAVEMLSDDVSYRCSGKHALAGVFSGREEVAAHFAKLLEVMGGSLEAEKWEDWLVGERNVAGLASIHAHRDGRRYSGRQLMLLRFDALDLIDQVTVYFEDVAAIDRFIGT